MQIEKQMQKQSFLVTGVDEKLLQAVYTYHFLTVVQVTRLLYSPGTISTVRARLKRLADNKYLHPIVLPTTGKGQAPIVFTLAAKGIKLLQSLGIDAEYSYRPSEQDELSHGFLHHALELNDFLIAAKKLEKEAPAFVVHELLHDLDLKKTPVKVVIDGEGETKPRTITIVPDAWLDIRQKRESKKDLQYTFWVELDRGTEEMKRWKNKLRAILAFIKSGKLEEVFKARHLANVIFITSAGEKRVEQMRKWTMEVIGEVKAKPETRDLFVFALLPDVPKPLELFTTPVWVTPLKEAAAIALLEVEE